MAENTRNNTRERKAPVQTPIDFDATAQTMVTAIEEIEGQEKLDIGCIPIVKDEFAGALTFYVKTQDESKQAHVTIYAVSRRNGTICIMVDDDTHAVLFTNSYAESLTKVQPYLVTYLAKKIHEFNGVKN